MPSSAPFEVRHIRITGNSVIASEVLQALVADQEGKMLTLTQLEAVAARITAHYRSQGYPLARAIVPAQTIAEGAVQIQVIEVRYGQVQLHNSSAVDEALLQATLAPLQAGDIVRGAPMERSLLLLSDIPGVGLAAMLKPGTAAGSSDLEVETKPGPAVLANVAVDNYGSRYTGRPRVSAQGYWINPLRRGDVASASLVSSGERMNYGRLSYELLLNGQGTRVGAAYSALRYRLGEELSALDANGRAGVSSLWVRQPLLRGQSNSVYAQLQYDDKRLRDRVDASALRTDRNLGNWVLSVSGELRDG